MSEGGVGKGEPMEEEIDWNGDASEAVSAGGKGDRAAESSDRGGKVDITEDVGDRGPESRELVGEQQEEGWLSQLGEVGGGTGLDSALQLQVKNTLAVDFFSQQN